MRLLGCCVLIFVMMTLISTVMYMYIILSNFLRSESYMSHRRMISAFVKAAKVYMNAENDLQYDETDESDDITESGSVYESTIRSKIEGFKSKLMVNLRRSEMEKGNIIFQKNLNNLYNVQFKGRRGSRFPSRELLCKIPFNIIENSTKINAFYEIIPPEKRSHCAMVSNSGAMIDSGLGNEINGHNIVMRFNNAPTDNYTNDVGNKTSIRVLNSQLILNESFHVTSSPIYRHIVKLVWDASDYDTDLNRWVSKRKEFFKYLRRDQQLLSDERFHLIHPQTIWKLWDLLQMTTFSTLPKTPPSSGFIGIIYLLKICSKVDIYEYVPSLRISNRCHYYDDFQSIGCTYGDWHPLATEKLYILAINEANDYDRVIKGKITITGCD